MPKDAGHLCIVASQTNPINAGIFGAGVFKKTKSHFEDDQNKRETLGYPVLLGLRIKRGWVLSPVGVVLDVILI